ncbi:MAG: cobalamin biosynthesis protein CobD [Deltaproteobacteria bacterium]|nr:cobalamin biosynthesis protein CobD [Deltaproteobacteria bacterium]
MTPAVFLSAYAADLVIGDPRWIPHPVVIIGRFIRWIEERVRKGSFAADLKTGGILLWVIVVGVTFCVSWGVVAGSYLIHNIVGVAVTVILASLTVATRSLFEESRIVIDALDRGDIVNSRRKLSMIVGRSTEHLGESEIRRAVIETVAENLSDGIVAPLLYLALGGVPLAMAYKAVNTLDSMVGYNNELCGEIGWFSAKMDDLWNWIPARLTGAIIILASYILRFDGRNAGRIMMRDGRNHSSPNSGVPEAAMAGALGIQLGGPIRYFGELFQKPTIGDAVSPIDRGDVIRAWAVMIVSSLVMALLCAAAMGVARW